MTIKRSSSPLDTQTVLLDSISQPVVLGKEIGKGGEGSVYEVQGAPSLLAKVYHKKQLDDAELAKLQAVAACWSNALETIAAWPRSLLFDSVRRKPCGLLMTRMVGARPLHELYGTTNRRRHFPEVGWHHLVLAARNTAAAFQTIHSANIVVGDVNQGNLLVDPQMCVRLIDCDSFQITSGGRTFPCPVGTPHFTPPELQALKLRDVVRTVNHDRFGLAVLIFHLLFVGRHPFAGRYRGAGDLSIERAIAERRFAFSRDKAATLVDPPPASLLLEDLPPTLATLFERAFRATDADGNVRPTPVEWVQELEGLMRQRKVCTFDSIHVYYAGLPECPWCRIEDSGGPSFFVSSGGTSVISADRLVALDDRISDLSPTTFPDLPSQRLSLPNMPPLKALKTVPKRTLPEYAAGLMATTWAVCLVGAIIGHLAGVAMLAAGSLLSIALAIPLFVTRRAAERRKKRDDYVAWLEQSELALEKRARWVEQQHQQREQSFERSNDELKHEIELYRTANENLQNVIAQHRDSQKADFLRSYLVRDYARKIAGLTASHVTMMESYNVESANDIDQLKLSGIPGVDPDIMLELQQWRRDLEHNFVFNPDHGITLATVGTAKEVAVRRYKISQARKILAGAKQIEASALVAGSELKRMLTRFDDEAEHWKSTAKQYRDYQSGRWRFERWINQSPWHILAFALGIPFAAWVVYLAIW